VSSSWRTEKAVDGEHGKFNRNDENKPKGISFFAWQRLRRFLKTEIELYSYLKQRLMKQYSMLLREQLPLLRSFKKKKVFSKLDIILR
jgi:hypothetical protein